MTWVKLDDNALDDPTFLELDRSTRLLHLEALAWSNRHGRGGSIPRLAPLRFSDGESLSKAAAELVKAGIWEETDDGWQLVWLLDDQPTPEEIEKARERNRHKQKRHRNHLRGDHAGCDPKWCKSASRNPVTNPGSHPGSNDSPTRPDPTLPEGEGEGTRGDDTGHEGPVVALVNGNTRSEAVLSAFEILENPHTSESYRRAALRQLRAVGFDSYEEAQAWFDGDNQGDPAVEPFEDRYLRIAGGEA